MNTFGKNLRQARLALGLSQQQLADMTQLSQAAISSYERGERHAARDILRLAEALKVSPQWLAGRSGNTKKSNAVKTIAEPLPLDGCSVPFEFDWPFTSVSPLSYYQLSEAERKIVEDLVQSLVELHPRG
ncbi:helix-turn-helix domain-containing protein [Paenalcaligenes niemegkensis]|uniref:helix-turn-helix domain-containing protein n=1 Tax=Paenalcaligenes niemegkensis TaxID=2895469 RepID=UPI001EE7DC3B|nr:helix-turn-helix transcriptional regulator [Paenalcaligenes niemegkensis]MCQ9615487.1 helix-turn-helix domain-containing protein [Paenalcaligenes niemegkensis]